MADGMDRVDRVDQADRLDRMDRMDQVSRVDRVDAIAGAGSASKTPDVVDAVKRSRGSRPVNRNGNRSVILLIDVGGSSLKANLAAARGPASGLDSGLGAASGLGSGSDTDSDLDSDGEVMLLAEDLQLPIDANGTRAAIMETFSDLIGSLLEQAADACACAEPLMVEGMALSFPGPCDYARGIPRLRGLNKYEALYGVRLFPLFTEMLREQAPRASARTGNPIHVREQLRVVMQNDARMYGYGAWVRDHEPKGRIAALTLGTGCGSSFLVGGELLTDDARRNRRERIPMDGYIYHLPLDGRTVDDWLSTRGLIELAKRRGLVVRSGLELAELAEAGNEAARASYRQFGDLLARVILDDSYLGAFEPDVVFLGGRISRSFPLMGLRLQDGRLIGGPTADDAADGGETANADDPANGVAMSAGGPGRSPEDTSPPASSPPEHTPAIHPRIIVDDDARNQLYGAAAYWRQAPGDRDE